jgi:hypothetical protein
MKYLKIVCLLVLVLALSCKKNAAVVEPNFVGQWETTDPARDDYFWITTGAFSNYSATNGTKTESHYGKVEIKKRKNMLYIDKKTFTIDQYPYQTTDPQGDLVWKMKLSGVEYARYF